MTLFRLTIVLSVIGFSTVTFAQDAGLDCGFAPRVNYPLGQSPRCVAIGDLDGDQDLDLAVAFYWYDYVFVLSNNGDGTFAMTGFYRAGNGWHSVAIGDLDGDNDLDLVVTNKLSDDVSVLLNNGDGTFAEGVTYGAGVDPLSVAIGDLDGDLDLDLVVASLNSGVSVLLNNGNGTFAADVFYPTNSPIFVAIGDLDGDLDLDLAVTNLYSKKVSVLLGNDDGTFTAGESYSVGGTPWSVAIGDLDGDRDLDLAVTNDGNAGNDNDVSVLLGNGDGTFATNVRYSVSDDPQSVAIGDLDGDLNLDLAVATSNQSGNSNSVSVLLGNGNGTFGPEVRYSVGVGPSSISIGDLDGDLGLDLAVTNLGSNDVSVLLNDCTGSSAKVLPNSLSVFRGIQIGGTLEDVFESDDSRMRFNPGFTLSSSEAPVWLIFDGTLPDDNPSSLEIVMESQAGTPGLTHTLEAWNWTSAAYDVVDISATSFNNDTIFTVDLSSEISNYVQPGTGAVRTRVGWRKTGPVINFPWEVRLDQMIWIVQ